MGSRLRLRLSAVTAVVVALAVVLTACGGGGSGRRGHSGGGSSGGDSGSSVGKDEDEDDDFDDDYDSGTDVVDPAPTNSTDPVALSAILPDLAALSGTVFTVEPEGVDANEASVCADYPEVCETATDETQPAFFTNDAQDEVATFQVLAFGSETDAANALDTAVTCSPPTAATPSGSGTPSATGASPTTSPGTGMTPVRR
jgi:hypothetical protein